MRKVLIAVLMFCPIGLMAVFSQTSYAVCAGTLGSWNSETPFPRRVESHTAVAFDGYIYVLGGMGGPGISYAHDEVTSVKVNFNGSLGPWTNTTSFTTGRYLHAAAIDRDKGNIYIIGGWDTD